MNIEQAYRTLGLKAGASFKEVVEAHEDLLALWHPDHLAKNPRLRSKAAGQVDEINRAYEVLMAHLGRTGAPGSGEASLAAPVSGEKTEASSIREQDDSQPAASLYDEVFSQQPPKSSWRRIPLWPIVFLIIVAGPVISYVAQSPDQEQATSTTVSSSPKAPPEPAGLAEDMQVVQQAPEAESQTGEVKLPPAVGAAESTQAAPPQPDPSPSRLSPAREVRPKLTRTPGKQAVESAEPDSPQQKPGPVLIREETPSPDQTEEPASEGATASAASQGPSDEALRAHESLLANSEVARKLVDGGFKTLHFAEWKVVQERDTEIWIDLIANSASRGSVHFIWTVDMETGKPRPLSQAARNLESDTR